MCLIVTGSLNDISKIDIATAWRNNPDGAGLLVLAKDPILRKAKTLEALLKTVDALLPKMGRCEAVLHLRFATHGDKSIKNIHPFGMGKDTFLFHNGMVNLGDNKDSDTKELASILSRVKSLDDRIRLLEALSIGSRYLIANTADRSTMLIGHWHQHKDLWYSNEQLVPKRVPIFNNQAWIHNWSLPD
jgi:predicted glutamine amidotransferase